LNHSLFLTSNFLIKEFDLDKTFGAVTAAVAVEGTIELVGRMNGPYATHEFALRVRFFGVLGGNSFCLQGLSIYQNASVVF
jgi:hypothetical protein